MKVLFFSVSSSFVHTLLAPRYLRANSSVPFDIYETNVNVPIEKNFGYIKNYNPDLIAFSCYIFNISYIKILLGKIREELPSVITVLGGYEAAFNADSLINSCSFIIKGEGDFSFGKLLEDIRDNKIKAPEIIESGTVKQLDKIKSPYTEEYCKLGGQNRILYMETSRGCPFGCSYCMSANTHGVRSFSFERIESDFEKIMRFKPRLIKLVDRTFNYDKERAGKIFSFLIEKYGESGTRFHFEMAPELFDENLFLVLSKAPKGLFQFEIGVQSYNEDTLKAVRRKADTEKIDANLRRIISMKNIPVHVDLIVGLPHENKEVFIRGFDRLLSIRPDCMQEGFLKVLPGSEIAENADGYKVSPLPPYEIISSPDMSEEDVKELKNVSEMLDLYYNSGRFVKIMNFILDKFSPYSFFLGISRFYSEKSYSKRTLSALGQSDALYEYLSTILDGDALGEAERLIYEDYILAGNVRKWHKWIEKTKKH